MALPGSGWLSTANPEASVTRWPLPAPIRALYRDGAGPIVQAEARPETQPRLTAHTAGGCSAAARLGRGADGRRVLELEVRMHEAFGVVLLDRVEVPRLGFEECGPRPAGGAFSPCAPPPAGSWSSC